MPKYKYLAIDKVGKKINGELTAINDMELEKRLDDIGLDLIDFKEVSSRNLFKKGAISDKELIMLCMQLQQLEKSGVPLLEALNELRDNSDTQKMHNLMNDICESVKNGKVFSKALKAHPEVFDNIFVGLVAAGEKTGQLHLVFGHLAEHLKWAFEIKSKIKKATTYPLFLLLMMVGIISLMMLYVVPKLSTFLTSQNFDLPFYTLVLIKISNFMENNWQYVFIIPIIINVTIKILYHFNSSFAYFWDNVKINLPVFGNIIRKIEISRFCRFFSITFKSGINMLECLEVAGNVISNKVVKYSIEKARNAVSQGVNLTSALKSTGQLPNMVIRMIKVGEEVGNLDESLDNVNFFYDKEIYDSVNKLIGMIQPTLTVIMGILMFWITLAVFGPLYGNFTKMNF